MKTVFILFIASGLSLSAWSQEQEPPQADSALAAEQAGPVSTLTLGLSYANDANYFGQRAAQRIPYLAAIAAYNHKSGFYLTGMAYRLLKDSAAFASAYSVGAGYGFRLGKKLRADLGYSHTFFPALSPFLQAGNPHNANLSLTHSGWLIATASFDYAFGVTHDVFGTLGISKEIRLFSPGEKDVVSITPAIDVTAGTQRFIEYYLEEKRNRDSILGLPIPPIFGGGGTTTTTTSTTKTQINLLSYNLKLPLAYSRAHYTLELAYQLSLLGERVETRPGKLNSFFGASFYYQF